MAALPSVASATPPGWRVLWRVMAMALAGCGGGGGGDDPAPVPAPNPASAPATAYTLSGAISIAPTAAVDSDLNDPNQHPYVVNDNPDIAQPLSAPVLLDGTVNVRGTGPAGNNLVPGDADDYFRVNLVAGQVVELEFATDPTQSDVDLYLWSADGQRIVGASAGTDSRFECVQVGTSGTYFLMTPRLAGWSLHLALRGLDAAPGAGAGRRRPGQRPPRLPARRAVRRLPAAVGHVAAGPSIGNAAAVPPGWRRATVR